MSRTIEFFLAPDDEAAAATRLRGPDQAYPVVTGHFFGPEEAVMEWDMYFEAPSAELPSREQLYSQEMPTWVAPILNDGVGVFVLHGRLIRALADASPSQLAELVARWSERLRQEDGDDMTTDDLQEILRGVARLAVAAVRSQGALYCWHD